MQEDDLCHEIKICLSFFLPLPFSSSDSLLVTPSKITKPTPKISPSPSSPLSLAVAELQVPLLKL